MRPNQKKDRLLLCYYRCLRTCIFASFSGEATQKDDDMHKELDLFIIYLQ